MKVIFAISGKAIRSLLRDKAGFTFTFFFPLIFAVFFGSIFGGGGGSRTMKILVVDQDQTENSRAFIQELDNADELIIETTTYDDAVNRVRLGKSIAYIALTPGFGTARERIFWGDPPTVELGVDPARKAEAGMLQGILMKYAVKGFQRVFTDAGAMRTNIDTARKSVDMSSNLPPERKNRLSRFLSELDLFYDTEGESAEPAADPAAPDPAAADADTGYSGFQPLVIEKHDIRIEKKGPKNAYAISFPQGIIWGIMGCAAGFGISLVVERTNGTLARLLMAPIGRVEILAGKALACFIVTFSIAVGLFIIGGLFFKLVPESLGLLLIALVCICICFVGIMMLLSVLGKTEQAAGGIGWAVLMVMAMAGGGMIPLFVLPPWMKTISHFSPVKWSILAMEGAIWRGFTLTEMLLPCGILLGTGIVAFAVGVKRFRWFSEA